MYDVAQMSKDKDSVMRSLLLMVKTLQSATNYKQAVVVSKRLLQYAWYQSSLEFEMRAYEMMAKQYFYLQDLQKADYYLDRFQRGKFELPDSKTRELAMLGYQRKIDEIQKKSEIIDGEPEPTVNREMPVQRVMTILDKCVYQIAKLQQKTKNGYFNMPQVDKNGKEILIGY